MLGMCHCGSSTLSVSVPSCAHCGRSDNTYYIGLLEIVNEVLYAQCLGHSRHSKKSRSFLPLMIEFLEVGNPVLFISLVPTPCSSRPATKGYTKSLISACVCETSTFRTGLPFLGISGFHSLWLRPTPTPQYFGICQNQLQLSVLERQNPARGQTRGGKF